MCRYVVSKLRPNAQKDSLDLQRLVLQEVEVCVTSENQTRDTQTKTLSLMVVKHMMLLHSNSLTQACHLSVQKLLPIFDGDKFEINGICLLQFLNNKVSKPNVVTTPV